MSDELSRNLASLADSETLRQFVQRLEEGIYITTQEGEVLDANPACLRMFGVASLEEFRRYRAHELLADPGQRALLMGLLEKSGSVRNFEMEIHCPNGDVRTVLDSCYAVFDEVRGEVLFHGILIDITARKQLESKLRRLTIHDPLTGCYNRRYLAEVEPTLEAQSSPWGTIVVDIDHFKRYNDRYGHKAGDEALVTLGSFLRRQVRSADVVVRLGGDEFLVLILGGKVAATERIAGRLAEASARGEPLRFSSGWAVREGDETVQQTIVRADRQLLESREGRRRREAQAAAVSSGGADRS